MVKNLIQTEFNQEDSSFWFYKKEKKFLHNVDTFYYSVKLTNDFTSQSKDPNVLAFRQIMRQLDTCEYDSVVDAKIPGCDQLYIRPFHFAGFYKYCFEVPEYYDIFIADKVPVGEDGKSVTSEIIVQIRSYPLWTYGVVKAFEESLAIVERICQHFGLSILEVKENRCDYCYHSNYLSNPTLFFRIDNFSQMQVSRYKRVHYEYELNKDGYENDYVALGKRSDKCFVRIYLKSKEVIEKGYKGWFFKTWFFNNLISRYDLYVYEECYKQRSWKYQYYARLQFYLEYGKNELYKQEIRQILDNPDSAAIETVIKLADKLTPAITLITNVEFQTTRKSSKSYVLREFKDNEKYGYAKRIYDYFDNRKLITEYLTWDTLRLVASGSDTNKSRADLCGFWKALRATKMVDCLGVPKYLKLVREYNRSLNKEVVKKKMLASCVTYGLYTRGDNDDTPLDDCAAGLIRLNDNDINYMKKYKAKRRKLLNVNDLDGILDDERQYMLHLIDVDGVLYE